MLSVVLDRFSALYRKRPSTKDAPLKKIPAKVLPAQQTEAEKIVAREKATVDAFIKNQGLLPANLGQGGKNALMALGVVFLAQDKVPPQYVRVYLPRGWKKISAGEADHRLVYLVDKEGRMIARIFHKDTFTDQVIYLIMC